ncbi:disulfide bond formation protein B [Candidimonas sp. SYP-B2681]|uniref:disulfide bond formation protein B n=1 Tax=Candidimonas sp. SYP-B2681 TaxID=2497686 RepID=UPI000F89B65E|nr:disulfide bond formation protein B [Candidimonas sp. SYP-B2681]RTZ47936.1 disulfide bond formation protein B [Candidimonas sp. SYP-B2681]
MTNRTSRLLHIIALLCVGAVAVALVSQHMFDMRPCAWCVFQRFIYLLIAAVCWLGLLWGRRWSIALKGAALAAAALSVGGVLAAWYQYTVAANMFSCDMTFADRFMVKSGLDANVPWLFGIFATCMDAKVDFLGVEYALWALALFMVTGILALAALVPPRKK